MAATFSKPLLGLICALVLLLVANASLGIWNAFEINRDGRWVTHTREVLEGVSQLHLTIREAESGQRGYILTGEKEYLKPYQRAVANFDEQSKHLRELVSDNRQQTERAEILHRVMWQRLEQLEEGIRRFDQKGKIDSIPFIVSGAGRMKMEEVATLVVGFQKNEQELLLEREKEANRSLVVGVVSNLFSTLLALAGIVAFMTILDRHWDARRRAAAEIEQQRELLSITLTSIGDAVIATDAKGTVTLLNPIAERMIGLTSNAAVGKPLIDIFRIVNEHTRKTVDNPVVKVLREGSIVGLANHTILIARDGTERPIDDSAAPIRDRDGKLIGVVMVFRDVTERKQAEKELQEARIVAEGIVNTVPQPLLILDGEMRVQTVNQSYYEFFHSTPEETLARSFFDLDANRWNDPKLRRLLEAVLPERKPFSEFDLNIPFPNFGERTFRLSGRKLQREKDPTEFVLVAIDDITQARLAEEEIRRLLREAEHRADQLRTLATASLTLNAAHSLDSVVRVASEEAKRVLDCRDALAVIDGSLPTSEEGIIVPLIGRNGQRLGYFQVAEKTKGHFTEDDRSLLSQLAHLTSLAIENARLYEELRAADRRKDEFLAMLAHELRNPLAPLRNALQILQMSQLDQRTLEQTRDMMERQIGQMVRLIDDLLDVSRITNGKIVLRKTRVVLQSVLTHAMEMCRPHIEKGQHALEIQIPEEPVLLEADPVRLAQVVANLLNNSAKYTPEGGKIMLAVELYPEQVWIRIRDDGIGIPTHMLPRIFEMFTQVDRSLERSQGGLGIGLTLVKRLVELHDGSVRAVSEGPGKGSEFLVRLPRAEIALDESSEPLNLTEEVVTGTPWKILVVDDNRDAADSLALLLEMSGHEIETAYDGLSAVPVGREFVPDIALLDIGLPGLNGYDLAKRFREFPELKQTTLVAVTGWGQDEDRRRTQEAGFDLHLVKPVDPNELQKLLRDLQRSR